MCPHGLLHRVKCRHFHSKEKVKVSWESLILTVDVTENESAMHYSSGVIWTETKRAFINFSWLTLSSINMQERKALIKNHSTICFNFTRHGNDLRRLEDNRWLKLFGKVMLNFKEKETEIFFRIKDQIDFPCSFIRASIERISKDPFRYARFSMFRWEKAIFSLGGSAKHHSFDEICTEAKRRFYSTLEW